MKIGVLVNNFAGFPESGRSTRACIDVARHAERLGFASVWVTDHIVLPGKIPATYPHGGGGFPYSCENDIHEPIALMGALAAATERVEIGTSVLVIPYRHPLLTAKMLATIDQISGGRIVLGAGVGWLREEFEALGLAPEIFEKRGAVTVDYLRAMQRAWTAEGAFEYEGPYVQFKEVGTRPHPARTPRIPVWMGGAGERVLRRSVDLAEGYFAINSTPEQLAVDTARLRELAEAAGRAPESLTVAIIGGIMPGKETAQVVPGMPCQGSTEQILDGLRAYADAGLDHMATDIRLASSVDFPSTMAGGSDLAAMLDAMEQVAAEILPVASEF
jgi:probable F420-dependent oxidoreductase